MVEPDKKMTILVEQVISEDNTCENFIQNDEGTNHDQHRAGHFGEVEERDG